MIPGFFPADQASATVEGEKQKPYEYRCIICGAWHVYPVPCPIRHVNEEADP